MARFSGIKTKSGIIIKDRISSYWVRGASVPTLLLILAGTVMALSVFDWVVVTGLPFLRNPAAITAIILMLMFAVSRLPGMRFRKGPVRWGVGFLAVSTVIEMLRPLLVITSSDIISIPHFMQWVQSIILFLVICSLAEDRRAFGYVWGGVVIAGIFMSIAVNVGVPAFTRIYEDTGRYGFNGVNLNAQAYWYALSAITMFWVILSRWPRFRGKEIGLTIAFVSVLLALLGTASRSGFLALIAGISVLLIFSLSRQKFTAYMFLVPALVAIGFVSILSNDLVVDRLGQAVDGTQRGGRDAILEAAWPQIKERYWTGYGPRYTAVLGEVMNTASGVKATHNTYAQISMTFGIPALLLWIGLVLSLCRRLWSLRREPIGILFLSLMACTIIYSLTSDLGYRRLTWVLFALAANAAVFAYHGVGSSASIRSRRSEWKGQNELQPVQPS